MAKVRLRLNNPFVTGAINIFEDGTEELERPQLRHVESPNDKFHTIREWDDLTDIAFLYYGDAKFWHILMDVNELEDNFVLNVGTTLVIPDINRIKALAL